MAGNEILENHAQELAKTTGLNVELVEDGIRIFVVIRKAPLPPGLFKVETTDILMQADQQYPLSAMDMFWTELEVVRPDGSVPQGAGTLEQYLGASWRRFSWHRNGVWKPAGNPLKDHYATVEARWAKEVRT